MIDQPRIAFSEFDTDRLLNEFSKVNNDKELYLTSLETQLQYFDIALLLLTSLGYLDIQNTYSVDQFVVSRFIDSNKAIVACTFGMDRSRLLSGRIVADTEYGFLPLNAQIDTPIIGLPASSIDIHREASGEYVFKARDRSTSLSTDESVNIIYCINPVIIWDRSQQMEMYIPDIISLIMLTRTIISSSIQPSNLNLIFVYGSESEFELCEDLSLHLYQ